MKIARLVNSNHPSSLGLHPIVYFYSKDGRHKTALFYAIIKFVISLYEKKNINDFIETRAGIEDIIWNSDYLIQQINRKYRSAVYSYSHVANFLMQSVKLLKDGFNTNEVIDKLIKNDFQYLTLDKPEQADTTSKDFNTNRKSAVYITDAIKSAPTCKICGGLVHRNSISIDHKERKEDGGLGIVDNGQLSHPYCNTGYKS